MRYRLFLGLACAIGLAAGEAQLFFRPLSSDQKIVHALNRLTFGPRPGDVDRVRAMGLKKWIDLQLHPERIPENPELTKRLAVLDSLSMSPEELVRNYPTPQMVRQMVAGRIPFPTDPERRRMLEKLVARVEQKQGGDNASNVLEMTPIADLLTPEEIRSLRTGTPQQRMEAFQALPPSKQ